jgi:hypothetical protein
MRTSVWSMSAPTINCCAAEYNPVGGPEGGEANGGRRLGGPNCDPGPRGGLSPIGLGGALRCRLDDIFVDVAHEAQ